MARPQIFTNGTIRTLEESDPGHEALVVDGSAITFLGSTDEAQSIAPDAEVVDLEGSTLLPAFTDSHTHFKRASAFLSLHLDFESLGSRSIADVTQAVRARATVEPPGKWIQGDGLDQGRLKEGRFPTRQELDEASKDHPVVLRSVGRHGLAANSLALQIAGIDETTPDPVGGRIERDADGLPTGVLHEEAKLRLDANRADTVIPPDSLKDRIGALSHGVELLNQFGIAAIHEMPRDPDQISDWLQLRETEPPRVRVRFYIRGLAAQTSYRHLLGSGFRSGFGDEWLKLGGVKFSIDGSGTLSNAMVYEPYPGQPDNLGLQRVDTDEFMEAVRLSHDGGLQIAVHAIGQRAVDLTLDAFSALDLPAEELAPRRHRIEHAYFPPRDGQLERIRDLGLVLSTQTSFIEAVGDSWRRVFDDDELAGVMPIADAVAFGIPVQLNSDFPCSKLNPFIGIQAAVTRKTSSGHVLDPSQAISVLQALRFMTHGPAHTAFEESWRGHLRPGYAADLVVVDRDPLTSPAEDISDTSVRMTVVGGTIVYQA